MNSPTLLAKRRVPARAAASVAIAAACFAPGAWSMSHREGRIDTQPEARYVVVSAPLAAATMRVMIPSRAVARTSPVSTGRVSKGAYLQQGTALASIEAATETPYVTSLPPGPVAVISGGFSGADASRPSALVIAGGEVNKQLNLAKASPRTVPPGVTCPGLSRHRWSGVLCSTGRTIQILATDTLESNGFADVERCQDALQSFPLIVEPGGKNGICNDEPTRVSASGTPAKPERRALVCLTANEIKLIVTDPVHLHTLATHLIASERCLSALNLSGSVQAGIGYRPHASAKWNWWPETDRPRPPLTSVIVVSENASAAPVVPARAALAR